MAYYDKIQFTTYHPEGFILDTTGIKYYNHKICGCNTTQNAMCPNCNIPLIQLLQFDTTDPHLTPAATSRYIRVFYCFCCALIEKKFYYQIIDDATIKVLSYTQNYPDFSVEWSGGNLYEQWQQAEYYPELPIRLNPITKEQRLFLLAHYIARRIDITLVDNSLVQYLHDDDYVQFQISALQNMVGGIPFLGFLWELSRFNCPLCNSNMPFLSIIRDEFFDRNEDIISITGEWVHIVSAYCAKCNVVGVMHENRL